jgi:hypothetical protein
MQVLQMRINCYRFFLVLFLFAASIQSVGASTMGIVELDWEPHSETLLYNSIGCADECWVAKVKNRKTKKIIAELRCDGVDKMSLYLTIGKHPRKKVADTCEEFEKSDKFEAIPKALKRLIRHP